MNTKAMYKLSYGLFVLTAKVGDKINGCITNTAIQVASEPNQISFAVNKANYTHEMLMKSDVCNISVISEEAGFELFKRFGFQSGREVDKFAGFTDFVLAENGVPYITKGTNAYFSIVIKQRVDLGSHTLFIGELAAMEVLSSVPSATYSFYQANIKPKPAAEAKPSDVPEGMHKWRCKICGYEYVGVSLPEDFICPVCKHPAEDFEQVY
jgi:flavin reductase (DIM6/NTAB) family NADH-FMN oxidoreductase RutF